MLYLLTFEPNMANPSWCLAVITMYFIPAFLATATHASASNFTGLNCFASCSYSSTGDLGAIHDPFADAFHRLAFPFTGGNRVEAPVNEHAEARFAPPCQPFLA